MNNRSRLFAYRKHVISCSELFFFLGAFFFNFFFFFFVIQLSFHLQFLLQLQKIIIWLLQLTRYFQLMQTIPRHGFLTVRLFRLRDNAFRNEPGRHFVRKGHICSLKTCDLNSCTIRHSENKNVM